MEWHALLWSDIEAFMLNSFDADYRRSLNVAICSQSRVEHELTNWDA
jgi:isocitrate dehydrogenase kinase/phosphatase